MFPNISKRTTAMIQVWTSVALIILALIMSFMPIIKINSFNLQESIEGLIDDTADNVDIEDDKDSYKSNYGYNDAENDYGYSNGAQDVVDDIKDDIKEDIKDEVKSEANTNLDSLGLDKLSTEVEITVPKLISGAIFLGDFISELSKEDADISAWLDEALDDEKNQENLTTAIATLTLFTDAFNTNGNAWALVFNLLITFICVLYIFVTMLILPIALLIIGIISLVHAIKNKETPEEATAKVASKLPGLLNLILALLLFQCAIPQISYAWGAVALLVITVISIVMNTVVVRLPAYREKDMKYANITQGISLVGIIGFIIFFVNFIKTGVLSAFLKGPFFAFMKKYNKSVDFYKQSGISEAEISSNYLTDAILMLCYAMLAIMVIAYISGAANRFALSSKKGSTLLAYPILTLPLYIIPKVIMSSKNLNIVVEGETIMEEASIKLSESGESALTLVLVGIIIMILAEIAFIVVPKLLCKDMTKEDMQLVLAGNAPDPNEATSKKAKDKAKEKVASK